MTIRIEPKALDAMIRDTVNGYPDECCGFFFGRETANQRIITDVLIVHNAKEGDKRRRYLIAPKDYLKAEQYADEHGLTLLGVYHSHPDHPAVPSEYDRVAAQPYFSYIILSIRSGGFADIRSWQLNDEEQFEEEVVETEEPAMTNRQ